MRDREYTWPNEIEPPILYANSQWAVTNYGLECLTWHYPIEKSRLTETRLGQPHLSDWIVHMAEKTWVIQSLFNDAFEVALKTHKPRNWRTMDIAASKLHAAHYPYLPPASAAAPPSPRGTD